MYLQPNIRRAALRDRPNDRPRFRLGDLVVTAGVLALGIDVLPYVRRHAFGDWGALDAFDQQQNEDAVRWGQRILSAYDASVSPARTQRIWVITEADRSVTTVLLPSEY